MFIGKFDHTQIQLLDEKLNGNNFFIKRDDLIPVSFGGNKIVQYFKKELAGRGQVFATDCSELAPALYEADKYFIVPRINKDGYIDQILNICREYKIKGVLSLIDPELILLAKYKQEFLNIGTTPIISDFDVVEM